MVRFLFVCGLLCVCGCDQLEEAKHPTRGQSKMLKRSAPANSPAKPAPPATRKPEKSFPDGAFATLKARAQSEFTDCFVLIGVNKNTARQEFQRIENIEVELKTSDSNPQQIQGIVRLYATQPFADNLPDVRHEFSLVYEYSPPQWFRTQTYEHSWSVNRAGLTNPAEQEWNYDVDFEFKRTLEAP